MSDPSAEPTTSAQASPDNSPDSSDRETDTFEDAHDTASVRSLTNRKVSLSAPRLPKQDPLPAETEKSELEKTFQKVRGRPVPAATEVDEASEDSVNKDEMDTKEEVEVPVAAVEEEAFPEVSAASVESTGSVSSANGHQRDSSNLSDLDNVNLDDDTTAASISTKDTAVDSPSALPEKEPPSKTLSLGSLASALPWSPSATSDAAPKPNPFSPAAAPPLGAPAQAPTRKLTSPFAWLSRGSSQKETPAVSPPLSQGTAAAVSPRRNTASSVATLTSNPEMMLSKLEEEGDSRRGSGRGSLKDRFAMIRMRAEAAGTATARPAEDDKDSTPTPTAATAEGASSRSSLGLPSPDEQAASSAMPASPNPDLAPGTVSGVNAGPSSIAADDVDWDLWQAVITEGPAAVARSSPEELNKAIATGIPNAIRGVIWQVLAQSKNEELEIVYHELVARGTEREKERQSVVAKTKPSPSSSASSVHSGDSGVSPSGSIASALAAATATAALASGSSATIPPVEKETSEVTAERKKKEKEDAAALQKLEKTIRRDLGARTSYSKFAASQGLQEGLFGVCKAYALFDEGVGYAQGMNFLIMPILFNMPEEEAFCLLVRLMNQYHLRDLFIQDMPGLHKHLYLFERLLEDLEPALYCHLHRRSISPHLYATQWFLTLFAYRFPLQLVLRIYDLILSEGLSAILKFGIVLMQKNATALLAMSDMSQLTTYLKDRLFDVYIDAAPSAGSILENGFFGSSSSSLDKEVYRADQFVRDACEVKLTPELVKAYTLEWEEKTRAEKEREMELETLRTTNANLTVRVRKFEERIESVDREQAALATELVRTKMLNEELQDENESLKGQVRELKVVIEQQPEQLEQAWKAERDDLMQRNAKVHEENQRVEKELVELEEQLVQTKMQYAEMNAQHEALSRKWTDLKRQFL